MYPVVGQTTKHVHTHSGASLQEIGYISETKATEKMDASGTEGEMQSGDSESSAKPLSPHRAAHFKTRYIDGTLAVLMRVGAFLHPHSWGCIHLNEIFESIMAPLSHWLGYCQTMILIRHSSIRPRTPDPVSSHLPRQRYLWRLTSDPPLDIAFPLRPRDIYIPMVTLCVLDYRPAVCVFVHTKFWRPEP